MLAGVVLSREPVTRHSLGQEVGERFAGVLVSWETTHAYDHVRMLEADRLVLPTSHRRSPRYRASPAGVEAWRAWLVSPISEREPLRDALLRLRSCLDRDFATMTVIIDLFEEQMLQTLEQLPPAVDSPLTAQLAHAASRQSAMACVRWCQEARDEIGAHAASSS